MANPTAGFGLKPVRRNGAAWTGEPLACYIGTGVGNVFIGDPVIATGTSNTAVVEHIGGRFEVGTLPAVTIATAGATNKIYGVVVGFMPVTRDSTIYHENATERVALVAPAWMPDVVFQVRDDASGTVGAALVMANANLVAGSGGSTFTGMSSWMLDASTPAADATFQTTILRAANIPNNDATTTSAVWEVQINLPQPFPGIVGLA